MKCPVCQASNADNASNCGQCHSDLEAFKQIESLDNEIKSKSRMVMLMGVGFAVVILAGGAMFMNMNTTEAPAATDNTQNEAAMQQLTDENADLKTKISELLKQNEELMLNNENTGEAEEPNTEEESASSNDNAAASGSKIHTVVPGESLWSIAALHYGDGNQYTKIVQMNSNIQNPDVISVGLTLSL